MSTVGCEHFQEFKSNPNNLDTLRWVHSVFVVGSSKDKRTGLNYNYHQTKIMNSFCHTCNNRGPNLHACIDCVFFGCLPHIREHTKEEHHDFSLELTYGQVHCTKCGDYIYDSELDEINKTNRKRSDTFHRRLFECSTWNPTEEEKDLLTLYTQRVCITDKSQIGLRGLVNFRITCYMNSVVQVLMHTPLLRDYFLSERHFCKTDSESCLMCILSNVFQEFYNGDKVPLLLHKLLHFIWTHAPHVGGDVQQDAHEFFIETLGLLHKHCAESINHTSHAVVTNNCSCIIHQSFTGSLQSDIVCQKCKGVSTTIEPIWDFALDLVPGALTLVECLKHFTKAELLDNFSMCESCGLPRQVTKQLSIKTLPTVVTFQLKRFKKSDEGHGKVATKIQFTEMLDMTPFMSTKKADSPFPSDNMYSLFAVINHQGETSYAGHYIAYVRQLKDHWYKCNDEVISRVGLDEVLFSEGYILFYHKHVLGYK